MYGYFPESRKSCLIFTPQFEDEARLVFGANSEWTLLSWGCNRRLYDSGQFVEKLSQAATRHPKPLILLSPNCDGHTYNES